MKRDEWIFDFPATKLAAAAKAKLDHHDERLKFWQAAKEKTLAEIKEKGITVSDSQSDSSSNIQRGYHAQIMVDQTYQRQLNESANKIESHRDKVREYTGWVQVLEANQDRTYSLEADDYLFFFGK